MKETLIRFGLPLLLVMFAAAACPAGERVVERQRQVSKQTSNQGFFGRLRDRIQDRQRLRERQRNVRVEIVNDHRGRQNFRDDHHSQGELILRLENDGHHHSHAGDVERFFFRNGHSGDVVVERQVERRRFVERQDLDAHHEDRRSFRLDLNDGECRAFFKSH